MKKYLSFCKCLLNVSRFLPVFIDNVRVYKHSHVARRGPLFLSWDLSHRCNLNCIHCNAWKQKKEGLSFDQKKNIVRRLGESGIFYLGLGGGEPLLDENLGDLIREAKKWRMVVNVSTNGLLLEEKADMLVASGVDFVTVSVDSHKPQVHDFIRGRTGLTEKIQRGIVAIKHKRRGLKPTVIIRTVISRLNIAHLDEHIRYWKTRADDLSFKPVNENGICYSVPLEMRLREDDKKDLNLALKHILKEVSFFEKPYYKRIFDAFFNSADLKKEPCFAGVALADMDCQANVYHCGEQRFLLGNLMEDDFMKIWNSVRIREWRDKIKKTGHSCYCWSDCFMVNVVLGRFLGGYGVCD